MATYYWRGGSGTWNTSSTTNWSTTSGGAGGFGPPTSVDDVIFNSASSGASYVVTVTDGVCHALTTTAPAAGTLTFNATAGYFPTVYGNISVHAACLWTVNGTTTQTAYLNHYYADATAATVTFGNAGVNTRCIKFNPSAGSIPLGTAYTFCNASTVTFAEVNGNTSYATFTCTSAAISIIDPSATDYVTERFEIIGASFGGSPTITLTSTTITMGQAGVLTLYGKVEFNNFGTVNTAGLNVTCARTYYQFSLANYNSSVAAVMANATIKATGPNSQIHGFRTFGVVNHAGGGALNVAANISSAFSATSLTTVDANSGIYLGYGGDYGHSLWTSASMATVTVGAGGYVYILGSVSGFTGLTATFSGAITVGAGGNFAIYPTTSCIFSSTVTTSGTLASPASFTVYGTLTGSGTFPLTTCAGNSSFTWTTVDLANTKWEQLTTTTFTATSTSPTTVGPNVTIGALKTNGGAVSVTNQTFAVGAQNAYFTVSTVDYNMYITTGGLTVTAAGVALNGANPTTNCTLTSYYYPSYVAGAASFNNVHVYQFNTFTSATSTSLTSVYWDAGGGYAAAFGALTTTGTIAAYTTIYNLSSLTATTGSLTNTNINAPSCVATFNGAVTYTTTDLTTAQFTIYLGAFVNGAFASTFTSLYYFYALSYGPSGKSISSGGAVTFTNASVTTYTSGTGSVQLSFGTTCTALTVNNLSFSQNGDYSTSSSTSFTAGATNSTFAFTGYSTLAFGAFLATAGASGSTLSFSGAGTATATTISTTNMTVSGPDLQVTATSTVAFTGNTGLSQSVQLNTVIGSSTVAFTNFSTIIIWGAGFGPPTHVLKGTTLTVDNSGLASSTFDCGIANVLTNPFPPVVFTGLATFNNVAASFGQNGYSPTVTFNGLTLIKGTNGNSAIFFQDASGSSPNHSIGALTATSGGRVYAGNFTTISSGAVTATNVFFDCSNAPWTAAGTVAVTSSPTSSTSVANFSYFINGTFSTTFTSYDVTLIAASSSGPSSGNAFYSTGNLVLDDTGRSTAGVFNATSGSVVFVTGAGVTTWTKKVVNVPSLTATGAGGLTLTSTTSSDGALLTASNTVAITGPFTLTNQKLGNLALSCFNLTVGGAFVANNSASASAGTYVVLANAASVTGATTFTKIGLTAITYTSFGAMSCTGEGSANSNPENTFQITSTVSAVGTSNLTIADYYNVSLGNVTAGGSLSLTHASQLVNATCTGNITQSQVAGTTTITRVRLQGAGTNTFTANGAMTMSTSAALNYFLSLSGAAVTSNAGSGNYSCIAAGDITFTGAVALTNTHLWAGQWANGVAIGTGTITVTGGATKPFAFTIDANAVPCDNVSLSQAASAIYPGMCFQTFTLSNSGSTFSVTSALVYKRPLISFNQTSSTSATISIPSGVTPTLTNVDFWRITPGGTSTKPWTGTSLGRVGGTIANLTTTAPKAVYYVGGAGSWEGAKWATSSGGTGSTANYPLPQDNINFDANSGGGTVTLPASIRMGSLFLAGTSPGLTRISYTLTSGIVTEIWVSGGISGPSTDPGVGNYFYLGDTTTTFYGKVVFVDGGSSDTNTVTNGQNMVFPFTSYGGAGVEYANAGTLNLSRLGGDVLSIGPYGYGYSIPLSIDASTRVITLTDSTFLLNSTSGQLYLAGGTFNLGSCSITTGSFYILSSTIAIPSTSYTITLGGGTYSLEANVKESIGGAAVAHLGNLQFQGSALSPSQMYFICTVDDPIFLKILVTENSIYSSSFFRFQSLGTTRRLYTLSTFNLTNNSGGTFAVTNTTGGAITLNGVAGARNQWTNANIASSGTINVLPASPATWYYSGGSLGSGTGWNAGTAPAASTGLLFF